MFFGAAPTIGSAHKGIETQRVFLGTAIPGDVPGNFHSALDAARRPRDVLLLRLAASTGTTCRPTSPARPRTRPSACTRKTCGPRSSGGCRARPRPAATSPASTSAPKTQRRHPRHRRGAAGHPAPQGRPQARRRDSTRWTFAQKATEHRGSANRTHRNMLVYLAADEARLEELDAAVARLPRLDARPRQRGRPRPHRRTRRTRRPSAQAQADQTVTVAPAADLHLGARSRPARPGRRS